MAHREANPFAIDPTDEVPVGLQLGWRLRALIRTGELGAGERLPSFRRLAEWSGVNVGTVRSVYEGLEKEGLVVSRQGQGTFVASEVEPAPELETIAAEAMVRAREAGFEPRDLAVIAMACAGLPEDPEAERLPDPAAESEALEVRRELRRQIARLEAELSSYTGHLQAGLRTAPRRAVPHVAGVGELEETRDTLIAQLAAAQRRSEQEVRQRARGLGPLGRAMSRWRAER